MRRFISTVSALMALFFCLSLIACSGVKDTTKFERGTKDDTAYTNTSAGLTFTKPSDWVFYTDDQMEQTFQMSKEYYKDPDVMEKQDVTSLYEFMAIDAATGNNVNMVVAKGNGVTAVEKYVDQVKKEIEDQVTNGMTVAFNEGTSEVQLGNGTWIAYSAKVSMNGIDMTQYYYARKVGKYFVQFTCTDVSGIGQAAFEKMFSAPAASTEASA